MLLVLSTYWNSELANNPICTNLTMTLLLLSLLLPHKDTISHQMETVMLFTKITLFYLLFLATEVSHLYEESLLKKRERNKKYRHFWRCEIKVIQSAWVLIVSNYLIFASVFQFVQIIHNIRMSKNKLSQSIVELKEVTIIKDKKRKANPKREIPIKKDKPPVRKPPEIKKVKKPKQKMGKGKNDVIYKLSEDSLNRFTRKL